MQGPYILRFQAKVTQAGFFSSEVNQSIRITCISFDRLYHKNWFATSITLFIDQLYVRENVKEKQVSKEQKNYFYYIDQSVHMYAFIIIKCWVYIRTIQIPMWSSFLFRWELFKQYPIGKMFPIENYVFKANISLDRWATSTTKVVLNLVTNGQSFECEFWNIYPWQV